MSNYVAGNEAKVIWTKLRNCHRDALRRQQKCLKSGTAAETIKKWKFQKQLEFLLPYMANRKRGENWQHSDDEESEPQFENTDTLAFQNFEGSYVLSVTEENDDVKTKIHDGDEDYVYRTEDTAESVENTPSFVKQQISEQPPKRMKKHVASRIHRPTEQREQTTKESSIEGKHLEGSKFTNDPLYNFFLSMYQTTRKMPPASQHFVRTKIFEVVSQTEASLLNIPQPPTSSLFRPN
jgi:hypothetical protein